MNNVFDTEAARLIIEGKEKWREWAQKIPSVRFDSDWDVRVIPPFSGAIARFWVSKGDNHVSVYLDAYSKLGWVYDSNDEPIPYYEIYPAPDGDAKRYYLSEVNQMMSDIRTVLECGIDESK